MRKAQGVLNGRIALITGASAGIGAAAARLFTTRCKIVDEQAQCGGGRGAGGGVSGLRRRFDHHRGDAAGGWGKFGG
jgi:NAD(P)-dependent dehydrogenase (short-subunit alcohol dehydrogenase family)